MLPPPPPPLPCTPFRSPELQVHLHSAPHTPDHLALPSIPDPLLPSPFLQVFSVPNAFLPSLQLLPQSQCLRKPLLVTHLSSPLLWMPRASRLAQVPGGQLLLLQCQPLLPICPSLAIWWTLKGLQDRSKTFSLPGSWGCVLATQKFGDEVAKGWEDVAWREDDTAS